MSEFELAINRYQVGVLPENLKKKTYIYKLFSVVLLGFSTPLALCGPQNSKWSVVFSFSKTLVTPQKKALYSYICMYLSYSIASYFMFSCSRCIAQKNRSEAVTSRSRKTPQVNRNRPFILATYPRKIAMTASPAP